MTRRLGVVVIGQSPRHEVQAELRAMLPADVEIDLRGGLDGLSRAEIDALAPKDDLDTLFTRLPDGSAIRLSRAAAERGVARKVAAFLAEDVAAVLLNCTGPFPGLPPSGRVILPSAILSGVAGALLPAGRLGLLLPLPEQTEMVCAKWRRPGLDLLPQPLVPGSDDATIDAAAAALDALSPDLVILDCMSYNTSTKQRLRRGLRAPVLLAVSLAARVAAEMLA